MRSILRLSACACLLLLVNAKIMEIHKSDGKVERYYLSDVKTMTFGKDPANSIGLEPPVPARSAITPHLSLAPGFFTITLALPSPVRMKLFDARGRLVAGIHEVVDEPGTHRFRIGRTGGADLGAGWYLVRASIGEQTLWRSVVVSR
mgnify:CR=1 FL=1